MVRVVIKLFIAIIILQLTMMCSANTYVAKLLCITRRTYCYSDIIKSFTITKHEKPLVIFMHVCNVNGSAWEKIVLEQMNCIVESRLYDACTSIFYGCSCPDCQEEIPAKVMRHYPKAKLLKFLEKEDSYKHHENDTINRIIVYSKAVRNCNVLYIHSKGVTGFSQNQHYWRHFMMYYLVYKWQMCVDLLRRGFYTIGVNKLFRPYYAGNFWWASAEYLATLNLINGVGKTDRLSAEKKLLSNQVKHKHVNISDELWLSPKMLRWGLYSPLPHKDRTEYWRNDCNPQIYIF